MDLRSENPYWLLKNGIIASYPSISTHIKTDITIIGGGITGALLAWHLCSLGRSVTLLDRRHIGMGSTAATTALLQYEIDTPLVELAAKVGLKNAGQAYLRCLQSIHDLKDICKQLHTNTGFKLMPSFQYASAKKDVAQLTAEYEARKAIGIAVEQMSSRDVKFNYGFDAPAGLFSAVGAQVDAYALAHALLKQSIGQGVAVYDSTNVENITYKKDHIHLTTSQGCNIKTKHLIIACGYESQKYLPMQVQQLRSTYAAVSEPFGGQEELWYKNSLIWETADPYLYMRTTQENRILIGGLDDDFSDPHERDKRVHEKAKRLVLKFNKLFPNLEFKTDFKWAGAFAGTKDGLPYIGSIKQQPNTYYALGFGGNGITFSVIAAQIIRGIISKKKDVHQDIFSFER